MWYFKRIYGWRLISNTRSCLVPIYVANVLGRNKRGIILPLPALLYPQWQLFCQETINFLVSCEEKESRVIQLLSLLFSLSSRRTGCCIHTSQENIGDSQTSSIAVFRMDRESKNSLSLINYWFSSNMLVYQELKYCVAKLKNFYIKRCKNFLVNVLFFTEEPCFLYSPYWDILTFDVYTM